MDERIENARPPMFAISIRQPWAEWIVNPAIGKNIENRSLASPIVAAIKKRLKEEKRPFTVLIHAGKHDTQAYSDAACEWAQHLLPHADRPTPASIATLPRGGIVGFATVRGLWTPDGRYGSMPEDRRWAIPGSECLIHLEKARPLPFMECRGFQHLFRVPAYIANAIIAPERAGGEV